VHVIPDVYGGVDYNVHLLHGGAGYATVGLGWNIFDRIKKSNPIFWEGVD